jgi:Gluconate 2-dehydrogenase subunit 3
LIVCASVSWTWPGSDSNAALQAFFRADRAGSTMDDMRRREVVGYLGAALALPFLPKSADAAMQLGEALHGRIAASEPDFRTLTPRQQALVTRIAGMIIPETDTPGATSVRVPQFIDLILTEWMSDGERSAFLAGLAELESKTVTPKLVASLDEARSDKSGAGHTFGRIKALTVYGYFTSLPVQRDILKTRMLFDGYRGDVPFTPAT